MQAARLELVGDGAEDKKDSQRVELSGTDVGIAARER